MKTTRVALETKKNVQSITGSFLFIRNHFISNLVLDSLKFKKILELQGKC